MKKIIFTIIMMGMAFINANGQTTKSAFEQRIAELEDKAALKNLVDTFSVLSDTKEANLQGLLFTEDAKVTTVFDGKVLADLKGRKQIVERFGAFLASVDQLFHQNGQQTVTINGNTAQGISYCQVTLITHQGTKKLITMQGVRYKDEYVKQNGRWYIKNRFSEFMWRDTKELNK